MLQRLFYYKMENLTSQSIAKWFRSSGQAAFKSGLALQGENGHSDTIQKSTRSIPLSNTVFPKLLDGDWIAPNSTVIGDVNLGKGSSIWFGAIIKGDKGEIKIGKNSIIQDHSHISEGTEIGDSVFVGANSSVRGATLESFSFVVAGAQVKKGAVVESYGLLAAGAVLQEGDTVPSGQVFAGTPAKYLRDLTTEEKHMISDFGQEQQQLSQIYHEETEKHDFREIIDDLDEFYGLIFTSEADKQMSMIDDSGVPVVQEDF